MRAESQTWDECFEIGSGYSFLRTGSYRMSVEHPPLARLFAALPLLWLDPSVPVDDPSWAESKDVAFGQAFLYRNRVPADAILFAARIPTVITAALLIAAVAWWSRRTFGAGAGWLAAALLALDPNVIAAARVVKSDLLLSLLGFLSVVAWAEYLKTRHAIWWWATAAAFGLAITAKFAALFLIPVYAVLWVLALWRGGPLDPRHAMARLSLREAARGALSLALVPAMALPAIALVYGPEWRKLIPATHSYRAAHPEARRLSDVARPQTYAAQRLVHLSQVIGLQDHPFWRGLEVFLEHSARGHQAYLLGRTSETGWWYYFPVAFLVKTPVASLCVIILAGVLAAHRWSKSPPGFLRSLRIEWWVCAIPALLYLMAAMANRVNTSERHLLPVYPFLFAGAAAVVSREQWRGRQRVLLGFVALLAVESAWIYPHYLAFFNFAVGGPRAGARYLLDSNLDWGQDLERLRDDWIARGRPALCLLYFGTALPEYYGLHYERLPRTNEVEQGHSPSCIAAISATPLFGLYVPRRDLDWVRAHRVIGDIGYSIYLYDLRRPGSP